MQLAGAVITEASLPPVPHDLAPSFAFDVGFDVNPDGEAAGELINRVSIQTSSRCSLTGVL